MSETVKSLARMYGVSLDEALDALEKNNILVLSADIAIAEEKLPRYSKVLAELKETGGNPESAKKKGFMEKLRKATEGDIQQNQAATQRIGGFQQNSQSGGKQYTGYRKSQESIKDTSRIGTRTSTRTSHQDEDERQKQLLSRDYIIFTHMALRKPVAADIITEAIGVKITRKTDTTLVVCAEAVEFVMEAAKKDSSIKRVADALESLKKYNMFTVLSGKISEENHVISTFIKGRNLSESIIVIGINRGLSTFIYSRNKANENDQMYVRIFERDITAKGHLANPRNQMAAFVDPDGKKKSSLSDAPKHLEGEIPVSGQYVFMKSKNGYEPVLLENELGHGGEANVYKVFSGTKCAKIFKSESNSELKMQKVAIMCSKYGLLRMIDTPIMERVAWPEKMLYNEKAEPVGYVMKLFKDTTAFSEFAYDTFEEIIPRVEKKHQITMAVNFAELIDFMHHNNVILCDINRDNILYDKDLVAYLVDLDSAQVADDNWYYPSNVGIPEFRSPEHIYDDDFSFCRKKADDVWIMQMLIFHMLTPDGDPYAGSRDFDDEREIIAGGYYPYQAGNIGAEDQIKGSIWHMIVSHFPKFLKELFWNSFHGEGKYFHEETRRSSLDWLRTIVRYQEALPEIVKTNPESGKYIPESYPERVQSKGSVKINSGDLDVELEELLEQLKNFSQGWN